MTDAWKRVDQVLQAALLRPPDERDRFLRDACAGDTALEREVRSLLAADEQAGSFLDDPAIHAAARALAGDQRAGDPHRTDLLTARMALSPGSRLGPYEISAQIGAGGMGEVYRATDTNLGRQVAIKVLPEAVAADRDRLTRFEREARTLAALNHPNIAAIYGLERSGVTTALVMELVEGPTLADRIAQGAMTVAETLPLARQIAAALEAAHEQGIIHRDLKPANIKLRPDGTVKVLDFGLAKQTTALGPNEVMRSVTHSVTEVGTVAGTPAYMAPEQARGERVDKRTDIWAFGCVLFEMLTGRRLFGGSSTADTIALVMTREIDWNLLPAQLPSAVRALLGRCLERDRRKRLGDVAAIRFALEDVADTVAGAPVDASFAPRRRERTAWMVAGAAMLAAAVLTAALYIASRRQEAQPLRVSASIPLPEGWSLALSSSQGEPTSLVVSPDGRRVAIVARRADGPTTILMRELDSAARPLAGTEGATSLFWSPDNRFIGFFADGKVKKVEVSGGVPTSLCAATAPFGGGTWSRDGTIVFSMQEKGNYRLRKVADSGGQPTDALPDGPADGPTSGQEIRPWFLSDGRSLLYVSYGAGTKTAVYAGTLDSSERVRVVDTDASNAQYANGYLLFLRDATLMAQPFDEKRLRVEGNPVPVAEHVQRQGAIPPYRLFSASQTGVLAYQAATEAATLAWVDRDGHTLGTIGERANYRGVALSHDETRVVAAIGVPANLFVINLSNGVRTQFTFDGGVGFHAWSHDDRFINFGVAFRAYRKPSNGSGASERILPDEKRRAIFFDEGSDGSFLMMIQQDQPGADLTVVPGTGDRTPFRLASTLQDKRIGKFSPDGRWVAYVSNERGSVQNVWVAPVVRGTGAGDVRYLISTSGDGGTLPQWSADGRELFYISSSEMLIAVQVNGDGEDFQLLSRKALFPIRVSQREGGYSGWHYAVSRDRFLVIHGSEEPVSIEFNWTARLEHDD